jgi:hypothetical protein
MGENPFDADAAGRSARIPKLHGERRGFGPCVGVRIDSILTVALNPISDLPTEGDDAWRESADSADLDRVLSTLADAEASTADARQQILFDSAAAFSAQANIDGYTAFTLLG